MDILIKNMEMPSCCGNCHFNQFHEANPWTTWYTCMFLKKDTDDTGNGRLAGCPLIPVPEHGDLIDKDKLLEWQNITCIDTGMWQTDFDAVKISVIKKAPIILERTT